MKAKKKKPAKMVGAKLRKKAAGPVMPENGNKGSTTGVTTGLAISAFWNRILGANAAAKKKLTDPQLAQAVRKEFPRRESVQPVGRVRSFFNRGVQGYGNPPGTNVRGSKKESFAYDAKGRVTTSTDWGQERKPSKKLSAVAKARAKKIWAKKKAAPKKKGGKIKLKKAA